MSLFPEVAGEYRGSQEKEWQMEGLCRFHGFELSMPKKFRSLCLRSINWWMLPMGTRG